MKGLKVDGQQQYIFTCQLDNYDTGNSFCQELHSAVMNTLQFCQEVRRMTKGVVQMESSAEPSTSLPTPTTESKKRSSDCIEEKASKRKKVECSLQEERNRLQEEIPEHHIGTYDIPVPLLREPPQYLRIREPKEWYVDFLVQMLSNDEDHEELTAPLLVIASVSKLEFKDVAKGSYTYEVIGGVQRFFAISKINQDCSSKEIATRKCLVYANSLSRPAALVLARHHNEYNQIQRSTSFPEVAACCRRLLFSHFADGNDDGVDPTVPRYNTQRYRAFKQECMTFLLSSQTSQAVIDQAIQMALLKHCIYTKLQTVFTLFEEGKLRGQKPREMKGVVLQKALEGKLAPKLHHFKIFQGIDDEKKEEILDKLIAVEISIKQAEMSCGALKATCAAKTILMKEVKMNTWEEVESELPHYANMDLSKFKVQKGKPFPKKFKMLCEGAKASILPSSSGPVASIGTVQIFAVSPGCLSHHQLGSPDTLLLSIKHVSCEDEVEAIVDSVCLKLKNCTVAITGMQECDASKILSLCEVRGATARVFALSAGERNVGTVLLGKYEKVLLAWMGPTAVPEGHLLADEIDSIVCQPAEEDTMISTFRCTSWINLLLDATNSKLVAEVYSESGELAQLCRDNGISCISIVTTEEKGMALASNLVSGTEKENAGVGETAGTGEIVVAGQVIEEGADTHEEGADTHEEGVDTQEEGADTHEEGADTHEEGADTQEEGADKGADTQEPGLPIKNTGKGSHSNRKKGKYPLRSQRDTQELLQELSEVEKVAKKKLGIRTLRKNK